VSGSRGGVLRLGGELVVIVLGVLIALWVEGYRQEREDRNQEYLLLVALQEEYAENRARVDDQIAMYTRRAEAQLKLVELGQAATALSLDSATTLWSHAMRGGTLDPADGVMNSAIGAGRLTLIQDPELQQLVARWPSELANFRGIDAMYLGFRQEQLVPFLVERIDPPPILGAEALMYGTMADGDYSAVLGTPDFNRHLRWAARIQDVYVLVASDMYTLLDATEARLLAVLGG
jgi:hypothetical protein